MSEIVLYDYKFSSASYRVRIALNLKDIDYETRVINLLNAEHVEKEYEAINPQKIVPSLEIDDQVLTQSLAIIEYLDQTRPEPSLLPSDPVELAKVRALCYAIAMEIHPICNLSVARHVAELVDGQDETRIAWMSHYIRKGLVAYEACFAGGKPGMYSFGDNITMADVCLMPQLFNARRWGVDFSDLTRICSIEKSCGQLDPFIKAHPDNYQHG